MSYISRAAWIGKRIRITDARGMSRKVIMATVTAVTGMGTFHLTDVSVDRGNGFYSVPDRLLHASLNDTIEVLR
jgi:hypothetical protein